jgi:hypothetical protein
MSQLRTGGRISKDVTFDLDIAGVSANLIRKGVTSEALRDEPSKPGSLNFWRGSSLRA